MVSVRHARNHHPTIKEYPVNQRDIVAFVVGWWVCGRWHAVMLRIARKAGWIKIVKDMP